MKTGSPLSSWRFNSAGSRRAVDELLEEALAAIHTGDKEPDDRQHQQGAREPPNPIQQARVAFKSIAKQPADGKQSADPERGSDPVEEQEAGVAHAIFACDRRGQRGQPRDEFGGHQGDGSAATKGVLCLPHADGRLKGELAEDAQYMMAEFAADKEPPAIGRKRRGHSHHQRNGKTERMLG